jgi:hypothetical protein
MKYCLLILLGFFSTSAFSGAIDCGHSILKTVYVQGDRSDGSFHNNKLLIIMGDEKNSACSDINFAYLENTDDAYDGVLSMAMAAFVAGKRLRVVVNDGPIQERARRIEWVNF